MKRIICITAALFAAMYGSAQEPNRFEIKKDSVHFDAGFVLPDSLAHLSPWKPDYRTMEPMDIKPSVSMTSVVAIQQKNLPARVTVLNNNVLRLGRFVSFSNGQSWNYGPFPNLLLDARTLSFPMPR